MSSPVVAAKELSLFYGVVLGLNNVSFTMSEGITGLVGPNGAGKSTLIKLITGQLPPSSGELSVFGHSPYANVDTLSRIGYCPEREQINDYLQPLDWLQCLGSLSGIPRKECRGIAAEALRKARLDETHWKKRIGTYSKGMKQRVKLAQAIMHEPRLIVLDEPMNGLDPMGRSEFSEVLKELHEEGTSIIISSHILHELETLCGAFLIVNWGRALASGTHLDIRQTVTEWSDEISIRCSDPASVAKHLGNQDLLKGYHAERDDLTIWVKEPEKFLRIWPTVLEGCESEIYEMRNKNQSLNSIFERMTR